MALNDPKTNPTHSNNTTIDNSSKKLVDANPARSQLVIYQAASETMWLSISYDGTVAAVANKGIPLLSGVPFNLAEYAEVFGDEWASGQVNIIAATAGPHTVSIFEAIKD